MQEEIEDLLLEDSKTEENSNKKNTNREISFDKPDHVLEDIPVHPSYHLIRGFICLYLFPIFGVVALYKSWQVHSKYEDGDYEGAVEASKSAKSISNWGIVISLIAIPIIVIVMIFSMALI